jgi:hypothetical protein
MLQERRHPAGKQERHMTRFTPFLAAAATVAILALSAGAASAMATNGPPSGPPGGPSNGPSGPSGPSNAPGKSFNVIVIPGADDCAVRADQSGLTGTARRTFYTHCQAAGTL